MKIAIIGAGNMGGAVAAGMVASGKYVDSEIICTVKSEESRKRLSGALKDVVVSTDNKEAVKDADAVMIAVKPWLVAEVVKEIAPYLKKSVLFISVAAGISCCDLDDMLREYAGIKPPVFRAVPNTPARIRAGLTFISCLNAGESEIGIVEDIFGAVGEVMVVEEKRIPAFTALASCGVAMALRYIRASMEAGIELGLFAKEAKRVTALTVEGTARMLLESGEHPEAEIDKVTTPGGITIKGINAMEREGFSNAVIEGFKACVK